MNKFSKYFSLFLVPFILFLLGAAFYTFLQNKAIESQKKASYSYANKIKLSDDSFYRKAQSLENRFYSIEVFAPEDEDLIYSINYKNYVTSLIEAEDYTDAIKLIESSNVYSEELKTFYLAYLNDKRGNKELAIKYYESVVSEGRVMPLLIGFSRLRLIKLN